jgi:hypothetical protein
MVRSTRKLLNIGGGITLSLGLLALAFVAWAIAPFSRSPLDVLRAGQILTSAPFSERIVVGDSRVLFATSPQEQVLFAGFSGATTRSLERFTRVVCAISDAPLTVALGVNDSKRVERNLPASKAAVDRILDGCRGRQLAMADIWPVEDGVATRVDGFQMAAITQLSAHIEAQAWATGQTFIPAPELAPGYSIDGVHFTDAVSAQYAETLAQAHQTALRN